MNEKIERLEGVAAALPWKNVDTDLIIRVERCAQVPRGELGPYAFEMARLKADGTPDPDCPLNGPRAQGAAILVAGENFGCGSSREMAVWAIVGMGIRCVIAPSFGDIFHANCFQNGVLPIRLPARTVDALLAAIAASNGPARVAVDLPSQTVTAPDGEVHAFEIDPLRKKALVEGPDAIGVTLTRAAEIDRWQAEDRARRPWNLPRRA